MDRRTGNLDSAFWSKKRLSRLCTRCSPRFFIFFYFLFSIEFDRADDIIIGPDPVDPLPPPFPPPVLKPNQRFCRCGGGGGGGGGSFFGRANSRNWRPFCFVLFFFFCFERRRRRKIVLRFHGPDPNIAGRKNKKKTRLTFHAGVRFTQFRRFLYFFIWKIRFPCPDFIPFRMRRDEIDDMMNSFLLSCTGIGAKDEIIFIFISTD